MQETLLSGTAHKAELPGWMAAGKTGTSQDFRDAWFIGYTANLVTGVWLGNDDNSPTKKATGGGLPVEIWTRFMKAAHQGVTPVPLPVPAAQPGGLLASLSQAVAPASAPAVNVSAVNTPMVNAPAVNAPIAANSAVRPAPTRASVRPEAAGGLDGWLVDRLFGGR